MRSIFFVGGGDLGGEGVAGGLVLGEVVFPLVLLDEGEADLLLLQLGQQCGKVGLIETLQGGGDFLHAQAFLQTMMKTLTLLLQGVC